MHKPDAVTSKDQGGGSFHPHPEGTTAMYCVDVVDLGTRLEQFPGQPTREIPKVALVFASGVKHDDGSLIIVTAEMTNSMNEKANRRIGHALEPAIAPLGFDWKIGVGLVASLAAREVIVSTLAQIYAASGDDDLSLRDALANDRDRETGAPVYTPATVAALLVFFVFALQCTSTIVTLARETSSWRWPALAFFYLLALAYGASFVAYRVVGALSA